MAIRPKDIYRGHRRGRTVVTVLVSVVVVLLVAAIVLFYSLQRRVVVGPDGTVTLDLPFLRSATPAPIESASSAGGAQLVIDAPSFDGIDLGMGQNLTPIKALYIPAAEVTAQRLQDLAAQTDVLTNALVLEMKPPSGQLSWNSATEMAKGYETAGTEDLTDALGALKAQNVYLVAQLSVLVDDLMGSRNTPLALMTADGVPFKNDAGTWLDPYNRDLRTYIFALMDELRGMGFDEILLTDMVYPAADNLVHASTGGADYGPDFAIGNLSLAAAQHCQGTGLRLSLRLNGDLLRGNSAAVTGQNMAQLSLFYDRFYLDTATDSLDADRALATANFTGDSSLRFVPILAGAADGDNWVTEAGN